VLTARAARYDARHSYHAPAALLADFAVFAFTSRTGVRTPGGNIISHPPLATVPLPILRLASPDRRLQLDPKDMRQVTTPSGVRVWITPGRRGVCIGEVDRALGPGRALQQRGRVLLGHDRRGRDPRRRPHQRAPRRPDHDL